MSTSREIRQFETSSLATWVTPKMIDKFTPYKKSEIKEVPIYKTHHVIALEVKDY